MTSKDPFKLKWFFDSMKYTSLDCNVKSGFFYSKLEL